MSVCHCPLISPTEKGKHGPNGTNQALIVIARYVDSHHRKNKRNIVEKDEHAWYPLQAGPVGAWIPAITNL